MAQGHDMKMRTCTMHNGMLLPLLLLVNVVGSIERRRFEPAGGQNLGFNRMTFSKDTALLSVQVYKTLSDAVIFDWFISLYDKDRVSTCDVVYSKQNNQSHDAQAEPQDDPVLLSPFLPRHRTFFLANLESNQSYEFHMMCVDTDGRQYATKAIHFTTEAAGGPTKQEFSLNRTSAVGNPLLDAVKYPSGASDSFASAKQSLIVPEANNGKPSIHHMNHFSRPSVHNRVSPHTVLGVSCAVVGLIILMVTIALAGRRYSQYRASPSRLWEIQAVQDLESMPSFIQIGDAAQSPVETTSILVTDTEGHVLSSPCSSSVATCPQSCCLDSSLAGDSSGSVRDSNDNTIVRQA